MPFCKKFCSYCDFYKTTVVSLIPGYLYAINKELELRAGYLGNDPVETIYIGGGTPSLLSTPQIREVTGRIMELYDVPENCEITIEGNPDDLTVDYLTDLRNQTPVNRLSIGIQSFNDTILHLLNRRHNALRAMECIKDARVAGFKNLSVDLIYGIPGMTIAEWQHTLDMLPDVEHISAYHLTVEPGTALARSISHGLLSLPAEEESAAQFAMLDVFTSKRSLIHYEISNLGKDGYFSKHNTSYWLGKKYLGIGPSAHSYNLYSRQWNIANVKKYIDAVNSGEIFHEIEELSKTDHFNEYLMVSLRTMWGVEEKKILADFGEDFYLFFRKAAKPFIRSGHLVKSDSGYKMTHSGWLISDFILSELILQKE